MSVSVARLISAAKLESISFSMSSMFIEGPGHMFAGRKSRLSCEMLRPASFGFATGVLWALLVILVPALAGRLLLDRVWPELALLLASDSCSGLMGRGTVDINISLGLSIP